MSGKHCRLYDENLVHNIMISTGLSIVDFLKHNQSASSEEICEFVEENAGHIIEDTIEHLNAVDGEQGKDDEGLENDDKNWPFDDEEENPPSP
jgi:hypothetical protein